MAAGGGVGGGAMGFRGAMGLSLLAVLALAAYSIVAGGSWIPRAELVARRNAVRTRLVLRMAQDGTPRDTIKPGMLRAEAEPPAATHHAAAAAAAAAPERQGLVEGQTASGEDGLEQVEREEAAAAAAVAGSHGQEETDAAEAEAVEQSQDATGAEADSEALAKVEEHADSSDEPGKEHELSLAERARRRNVVTRDALVQKGLPGTFVWVYQVPASFGTVQVHAEPDAASEVVGTIAAGEVVVGVRVVKQDRGSWLERGRGQYVRMLGKVMPSGKRAVPRIVKSGCLRAFNDEAWQPQEYCGARPSAVEAKCAKRNAVKRELQRIILDYDIFDYSLPEPVAVASTLPIVETSALPPRPARRPAEDVVAAAAPLKAVPAAPAPAPVPAPPTATPAKVYTVKQLTGRERVALELIDRIFAETPASEAPDAEEAAEEEAPEEAAEAEAPEAPTLETETSGLDVETEIADAEGGLGASAYGPEDAGDLPASM